MRAPSLDSPRIQYKNRMYKKKKAGRQETLVAPAPAQPSPTPAPRALPSTARGTRILGARYQTACRALNMSPSLSLSSSTAYRFSYAGRAAAAGVW